MICERKNELDKSDQNRRPWSWLLSACMIHGTSNNREWRAMAHGPLHRKETAWIPTCSPHTLEALLRGYLVYIFKRQFSVFKQYFTYFKALFHPHVFSQIFLNNNFQFLNTHTKRALRVICIVYGLTRLAFQLFYYNIFNF